MCSTTFVLHLQLKYVLLNLSPTKLESVVMENQRASFKVHLLMITPKCITLKLKNVKIALIKLNSYICVKSYFNVFFSKF